MQHRRDRPFLTLQEVVAFATEDYPTNDQLQLELRRVCLAQARLSTDGDAPVGYFGPELPPHMLPAGIKPSSRVTVSTDSSRLSSFPHLTPCIKVNQGSLKSYGSASEAYASLSEHGFQTNVINTNTLGLLEEVNVVKPCIPEVAESPLVQLAVADDQIKECSVTPVDNDTHVNVSDSDAVIVDSTSSLENYKTMHDSFEQDVESTGEFFLAATPDKCNKPARDYAVIDAVVTIDRQSVVICAQDKENHSDTYKTNMSDYSLADYEPEYDKASGSHDSYVAQLGHMQAQSMISPATMNINSSAIDFAVVPNLWRSIAGISTILADAKLRYKRKRMKCGTQRSVNRRSGDVYVWNRLYWRKRIKGKFPHKQSIVDYRHHQDRIRNYHRIADNIVALYVFNPGIIVM